MVLRVAHDRDAAAVLNYRFAFRHRIGRVVGAFSMKVGPDRRDYRFDIRFVENCNEIDKAKARYDLGAFGCGYERPVGTFQFADLSVGIYRDNKESTEFFGPAEVSHVSGVEQVEAAVSKYYLLAPFSGRGYPIYELD